MIKWICKEFHALLPNELYAGLRLRSEVFVVEQDCVFLDMDNLDQLSHHLMGWVETRLVAYSRIMPAGVPYETMPSIGRIATSPSFRKNGAGRLLVNESIIALENLYGKGAIKIGAQLYLKNFYESFGFCQSGEIYTEDGIPHIAMIRPA